jgi:hypothetical protein
VVDAQGKLYFIDHFQQRIHGWSEAEGLTTERDAPLDPVNLAMDRAGNLIVLSSLGRNGTVYAFKPGTSAQTLTVIPPTAVPTPVADRLTALPGNLWVNGEFRSQLDPATYRFTTLAEMFARDVALPKAQEYVSPDGTSPFPPIACSSKARPIISAGAFPTRSMPMAWSPPGRRARVPEQRVRRQDLLRPPRRRWRDDGPATLCRSRRKAWQQGRTGASTSPMARSSSTTRRAARSTASTCPNAPCNCCSAARIAHALHPHPSRPLFGAAVTQPPDHVRGDFKCL